MNAALRCFFCGEELRPGKPAGRFTCGKCRANFTARTDSEGCVLGLEVAECGAEDCCRHRNENRSS